MSKPILIVGQGIAGSAMALELISAGTEVFVIDDDEKDSSSKVAGGVFNPLTGKKIVKTWRADDLFPKAIEFYRYWQRELGGDFLNEIPVYRVFADTLQQNDMMAKTADKGFKKWVNVEVDFEHYSPFIHCGNGGIEGTHSGWLFVADYLKKVRLFLEKRNAISTDEINYDQFDFSGEVKYKGQEYSKVIFCEGHRSTHNPWFSWLPFALTKGETLEIEVQDLPKTHILNRGFFVLPLDDKKFLAGSSFDRELSKEPSKKGRLDMENKLRSLFKSDYKVVGQRAGIRPTVKDRRPLIGTHPEYSHVHVFNGMGTKGVTLAPYFAEEFVRELKGGESISTEVNIQRYYSLYSKGA